MDVKNVEVTVEVTNSGDENLDDVNMQPRWANIRPARTGLCSGREHSGL